VLRADGNEWRVKKVSRSQGKVVHELEGEAPPQGGKVRGEIDWERRYELMRTHTALHILCGVVWRNYGAKVTGSDMKPLSARMDFEFDKMTAGFADEIEDLVNKEVEAARPVKINTLPRAEAFEIPDLIRTKVNLLPPFIQEIRTVDIDGLDLQADGGTHVANTSEVGRIRVVGHESKGRINKRLRIEVEG
jgi:misacylated tRNA(Ala) deacylase